MNGSAPRDPTQRPAPAIPDCPQVRRVPASASSTGYAQVYEDRQRRGPASMRGNDTASGAARTRQQVRADVHTTNITRSPSPSVSSERQVQVSRNGTNAQDAIYDVGITDYSSNDHSQEWLYEQGYQRLQVVDEEGYEVPISVPWQYMNKEAETNEENVYLEIDDVEMMIQGDADGNDDDDDDYDDTEL